MAPVIFNFTISLLTSCLHQKHISRAFYLCVTQPTRFYFNQSSCLHCLHVSLHATQAQMWLEVYFYASNLFFLGLCMWNKLNQVFLQSISNLQAPCPTLGIDTNIMLHFWCWHDVNFSDGFIAILIVWDPKHSQKTEIKKRSSRWKQINVAQNNFS